MRRRQWAAPTGLVLAASVVLAGLGVTEAPASAAAGSPRFGDTQDVSPFACADVLVVGARGSGETEGYGDKVGTAVQQLKAMLDPVRSVRYVNLSYPAAPMSALADDVLAAFTPGGSDWTYYASVHAGTEELVEVLGDSMLHCPDERWLLVGYSQGALVIDQAEHHFPEPARYAGIVKIADPGRTATSGVRNVGTASPGSGITESSAWVPFSLPTTPVPAALTPVTVEVCNDNDLVCDTPRALDTNDDGVLGAGDVVAAGVAAGVTIHTDTYGSAVIGAALDVVRPRILSMPVVAQRHTTVTSCLGEPVLSGQVVTKTRPTQAPPVRWSVVDGYSLPDAAAEAGVVWDATHHGFSISSAGSWQATLPLGGWSIPVTGRADGYPDAHAWLDISVARDCETAYTCGPALATSSTLETYATDGIFGRVLCPDGRPAGGASVWVYNADQDHWSGPTKTNDRGWYWLWGVDDTAYVRVELDGFPEMVGGDPRGVIGDARLGVPYSETGSRAPDYRFTEFGHVTGTVTFSSMSRDEVTLTLLWDEATSEFTGRGESCVESGIPTSRYCEAMPSVRSSYDVRVIPGDYRVFFPQGGYYWRWYGSDAIDQDDDQIPNEDSAVITVRPGETLDLGATELQRVAVVRGHAYTAENGADRDFSAATDLPVNVYVKRGDQWEFFRSASSSFTPFGVGYLAQGDWRWGMDMFPGTYKVVVNDPQADGYDDGYDTVFYPGVHHLSAATEIAVGVSDQVELLGYQLVVAPQGTALAQSASVSGVVRDSAGQPMAGAYVTVVSGTQGYTSFTTGADGTYLINGLPPGDYTLTASLEADWSRTGRLADGSAPVKTLGAASDLTGVDFVMTESTDPPTLQTGTPTIAGAPQVGRTLTAVPGAWTSGTTFEYEWRVNGVAVPGTSGPTFTPRPSDVGKRITVWVTGSKPGYVSMSVGSDTTSPVAAGTLTASTPVISGTAKVGVSLTARPGTWTTGTALTYQWYASGKAIPGATSTTFKPAAAHRGTTITVRVTGRKTGYATVTKGSAATKTVAAGTLTGAVPTIRGTAKVGTKLTVVRGTWTTGVTFTYQWYASGKAITGATRSTFTPTAAHRGKTITVKVTGKKTGYTTLSKTSRATARVK